MKKLLLTLQIFIGTLFVFMPDFAFAQDPTSDAWVTDSSVTYGPTKVGIGTSPVYNFDVVSTPNLETNLLFRFGISGITNGFYAISDITNKITYNFLNGDVFVQGNVGIGTFNPLVKLDVNGGARFGNIAGLGTTQVVGIQAASDIPALFIGGAGTPGQSKGIKMMAGQNSNDYSLWVQDYDGAVEQLYLRGDGNVGIGTTTPDNKLDVNGTIRAKEVKVETNWSDFVFEDNYNLPSLSHVESYIKENKHLPDIPSAKQVEEDGLSMSQMMAKQMQKIEELTLYVIELKKENDSIKKELAEMKKY